MITVYGDTSTNEYQAALRLKDAILSAEPAIEHGNQDIVAIFSPLYTPGQKRQELDLVVIASFAKPREVRIHQQIISHGKSTTIDRVLVHSFCCVIEVKDTELVLFDATKIIVTYPRRSGQREKKDDAVKQSREQKTSLFNYISINNLPSLNVSNLIWLTALTSEKIPEHGYIQTMAGEVSFSKLLTTIVLSDLQQARNIDGKWIFDCSFDGKTSTIEAVINGLSLRKEVHATKLDRKRLNALTGKHLDAAWFSDVGQKQVVLRGRAGSGKTFALLKLAIERYNDDHARTLILTYNHALVADLQRQLLLLGIPSDVSSRSIRVINVHQFMLELLRNYNFAFPRAVAKGQFEATYVSLLTAFLEYLRQGAVSAEDLDELRNNNSTYFDWDYVCIDEGQDWQDAERDILQTMYGKRRLLIAVGPDQLIRQNIPCDWALKGDPDSKTVQLKKCLRMRSNLATFVNAFAEHMGVGSWSVKEAAQVSGGKIIVVNGDLLKAKDFQNELIADNAASGNQPIDMLYCLPGRFKGITAEDAVHQLSVQGLQIWNGVDENQRKILPWFSDQTRVVKYESCRGLEGWAVVAIAIDDYFEYRMRSYKTNTMPHLEATMDDEEALLRAAEAIIVPLTRAIDTLVLNISKRESKLGQAFLMLQSKLSTVRWIDL